jgi:hypothetical protein
MLQTQTVLFICILTANMLFAQENNPPVPYDKDKNVILYEEVVQVSDMSKDALFDKILDWLNGYMVNLNSKIIEKDQNEGLILLNYHIQLYRSVKNERYKDELVKFKIEFRCREGRYKYRIYDFHTARGSIKTALEKWILTPEDDDKELCNSRLTQLNEEIEKLISDMKKGIAAAPADKNDDW